MIGKVSHILMTAVLAVSLSFVSADAKPKMNPKVSALLAKSYACSKAKNYSGSLNCLDKALEIEPRAAALFFLRAEVRRQNCQLQDAVSDYQTASMYLSMEGKEKQAKFCTESAAQIETALAAGKTPAPSQLPQVLKNIQYKLDHPSAVGTKPKALAATDKPGSN